MKVKKFILVFLLVFLGFQLSAQATISRYPGSMFWKITGTDSKGQPSEIYVLGTIHVGDDRLFPLPDYIEEAWKAADKHVCEISSKEWSELKGKLEKLMIKSANNTIKLKRNLKKELTEEEIDYLYSLNPMYKMMMGFEPWVLNQVLTENLLEFSELQADKGYDNYFMNRAAEEGIELEGLDELQVQLDVLTFGDWDYQLNQVKQAIKELQSGEAVEGIKNLYEAYLTFDENEIAALSEIESKPETSDNSDNNEFRDAVFLNRNSNWSEEINNYLLNGGKTFIFAGCGHFVGDDSVFILMKNKGYLEF